MMPCLRGDTASFARIQPAGFRILAALDTATRALGVDLEITCGTEDHAPDDPHSTGEAYDVRTRGLPVAMVLKVLAFLRQMLPEAYFTVLLETPQAFTDPALASAQYVNPHATGQHLHIQRRKGTTYPPIEHPSTVQELKA